MFQRAPAIPEIDVTTLRDWMEADKVVLVDVREVEEWRNAHIDGALLNPMSAFDINALPPRDGRHLVIMCRSGKRSMNVGQALAKAGTEDVYNLAGGILDWVANGYPVTQGD